MARTITPNLSASLQMSNLPHAGNIEMLRADLRHFEQSGDSDENPTIMEIKAHLLRRIAELEAAQRPRRVFAAFPVLPKKPG